MRVQGFPRVLVAVLGLLALWPVGRATADESCAGERGDPRPSSLTPKPAVLRGAREVRLRPAQTRTVGYDLTIPADARRLDVYFTIDTTGSMSGAICGLQRNLLDIAYALADAGIDARFGLAEFRDYPFSPYGSEGDWAYRQDRDIGPLDRSLVDAVGKLVAGGGGDGLESSLAALYQTATGEGQDVAPPGRSAGDIAAGKQARFRSDALKLVINITDAPFRERNSEYPTYPGPGYDKVVSALRSRGILQAGIAVASDARPDLARMARSTGALAPPGGVDCDDDGTSDIAAGEPLVCSPRSQIITIDGSDQSKTNLAPAIVNIVKSLRDAADVRMHLSAGRNVVKRVSPASVAVDLKAPQTSRFNVTYTCEGLAGNAVPVRLSAVVRGREIAWATTGVVCTVDAATVTFAPSRGAAAPGPPAQHTATQSQTQAQSNAQAQGQAQAQAQAQGFPAVAFAPEPEVAVQHAMSRRRVPPVGFTVAVGLVLGCAALFASRSQVRTERIDGRHPPDARSRAAGKGG